MTGTRFKPYPETKDSGVKWLGQIPEHWATRKLKYGAALRNEKDSEDSDARYVGMENVESWTGNYVNTELEVDGVGNVFRPGDVLFGKLRPYLAKAYLATATGQCSSEFLVLNPTMLAGQFLRDLVLSREFVNEVDAETYGTKMPRANWETVGGMRIPLPSRQEQLAIVDFLDRETAKIDALVEKKERLIDLLQEKRSALITHAVTKGLDPSVPMRDSGIEWLGQIPAHWESTSLKRVANRIQTGMTPPTAETKYYEEGTIPWYGPGSFSIALPIQKPVKFLSNSAIQDGVARMFDAGSTMIVTIGATIGKVAYLEELGSCNQQITGVSFDANLVAPRYGAYQLKRLESTLRGIAPNTTLPILDQEEVGYLPLAIPPAREQRAITDFLDRETARIDSLIAKVGEAIERLKEYRTALISAAVTGKIDVRDLYHA